MQLFPRIIFYVLFLSCAILPLSFQISTIGIVTFSGLVLIHGFVDNKAGRLKIKKGQKLFALPLMLFFIPLIGLVYTSYASETIDRLVRYLPYLIVSLAYFFAHDDIKKGASKYLRLGLISGVCITFIFLFIMLLFGQGADNPATLKELFSYKHTYRNFIKPLDTHTTYLGLLTLMANIFVYRSNFKSIYKIALLALNLFGLIFMASKMILVLYALQVLALFFFLKSKKQKLVFVFLVLSLAGILTYLYKYKLRDVHFLQRISREIVWDFDASNVGTSVNGKVEDDSRLARWKAILEKANEKVFFGHGSGSEKVLLQEVNTKNGLTVSMQRKYNTHNQYLFFFLELGLFGLAIFLSFFYSNLIYVYRQKNYELGFLILCLLLISVVENYFNRTMGVLAVSLFFTFLKEDNEKDSSDF